MIDTTRVRREVEDIRRKATESNLSALRGENLINWLRNHYYQSDSGESQLEMFLIKYPWNANAFKAYILREANKYRITTKQR